MKKSLTALLIMALSLVGAKASAARVELKLSKISLETKGIGPGGNGVVRNGVTKSK